MKLPTASALQRVIACPGSEGLPHVHRESEDAKAGTSRHWYLEHVGKMGPEKALEYIPEEHREMCASIDLDGLPTHLDSEVAFAYNWRTGKARLLGQGLHRDYSQCTKDEIAGTIDVVGIAPDKLYLGDYKGWALVKARDNAQLLFAALCATQVYERDEAVVEIINVRGGTNWRSKATVDAFDLADFGRKLRDTMEAIELIHRGAMPTYSEGEHCKYCPAFDSCPAKTRTLAMMVAGKPMVPLTRANARESYEKFLLMKEMMGVVSSRIHAYAKEHPIDLGDGTFYGEHEKKGKEVIDGDTAYKVVRDRLGQEAADLAVSRTATKKGIDKAVRRAKEQGVLTGTLKAENGSILTELRAMGAAKTSKKTSIGVYRPKAKELEGAA